MLIDFTASFIIFLSLLLILFLVTAFPIFFLATKLIFKLLLFLSESFLKKIGNAVTRNRIKRRLRNIMNEAVKSININLNYCYLLIARISVSKDPYEKIKNSTLEDFKKIK